MISAKTSSSAIIIGLIKTDTGECWEVQYDEEAVENLTRKSGNAKSFKVFCKMLYSAMDQSSESVILDVLTARDLELLKERKMKESSAHGGGSNSHQSTC